MNVQRISSRDNPLLLRLRRLLRDGAAYRRLGEVWLEGDHLCRAALDAGLAATQAVIGETAWTRPMLRELAERVPRVAVLPDALFAAHSALEAPTGLGLLIEAPTVKTPDPEAQSVVLDRLQDPGNVGSILRSAAALGATQVLALKGSVALWSPKVLRAGMGAHFALRLVEGVEAPGLEALARRLPLVTTSSHTGAWLHEADLPRPCAWLFGHEGQGSDPALQALATLQVRIAQPGGEESLNVAAAAAICLYESSLEREGKRAARRQ